MPLRKLPHSDASRPRLLWASIDVQWSNATASKLAPQDGSFPEHALLNRASHNSIISIQVRGSTPHHLESDRVQIWAAEFHWLR